MLKKKILAVILAVLMITSMFSGCSSIQEPVAQEPAVQKPIAQEPVKQEPSGQESSAQDTIVQLPVEKKPLKHGPLRIVVDLNPKGLGANESTLDDLKWWITAAAGIEEEDCVFEWIPTGGAERDTAIDRLRTEIMSGEGPDVFIAQSDHILCDTALFQMPEKAMELGFFLPLDEYIKSAEYAEWDKFTEIVMEAGRNEEGQQLVPLTYMLPAAMYRQSDVQHTPSQMTWKEMQNTEELQDAVIRLGAGYTSFGDEDDPIEFILGDLADYKNETLLFTEEELLEHVTEILQYSAEYIENKYAEKRYCTKTHLGTGFNNTGGEGEFSTNGGILNGLTEHDPLTLVPLYSDDGGSTAVITAFAAVNRNTRYPEEAFKVIDLLMSTSRQANADLFHQFVYPKKDYKGMPLHEDLMSSQYIMKGSRAQNQWFSLTDENFNAVCAVRDTISNVHFAGTLDIELESMMRDCFTAYENGEDYTQIVHDAYSTMKQMMSE